MKTLTKLISLSICGMLLVGCSNKAQDNTTKTTNDNNITASTTNAQDVNNNTNSSTSTEVPATTSTNTGEVDLTNLTKDSKQIYDIIVAKYPSATLLSDDEKKLITDYNNKYSVINNHKAKDDEEFKNQTIYVNIASLSENYIRYTELKSSGGDKQVIEASQREIDRVLHDVGKLNP